MRIYCLPRHALLLVAFLTHQANAQLEGTLFTQPEEREYLDYLREEFLRNNEEAGFDIEEVIPVIPDETVAVESGPQEFTYGGIMTRRDGTRSVWLNGRLLAESELPSSISLVAGNSSASLRIAKDGKVFVLRPGQTVSLATGAVIENYQRVAVVEPQPAAAEAASTADANTTEIEGDAESMARSAESDEDGATEAEDSTLEPGDTLAEAILRLTPEDRSKLVESLTSASESDEVEEEDETLEDE